MRLFQLTLGLVAGVMAGAAHGQTELHDPWDTLLSEYVHAHPDGVNRFDYAGLRSDAQNRQALELYIESLEATDPDTLSNDAQFAFWANLYNAVTVRLIVEEAPERSIRQIRPRPWAIGPWGVNRVEVRGQGLSLDDIEHGILREQFNAPLVHYAVNCASIGCPNLMDRAFRAETLQADLEAGARAYINHPRGVTVTEDGLVVSRIYAWFDEDFGGHEQGVIAHLLTYADADLAAEIQAVPMIDGYEYDWSLNRLERSD